MTEGKKLIKTSLRLARYEAVDFHISEAQMLARSARERRALRAIRALLKEVRHFPKQKRSG